MGHWLLQDEIGTEFVVWNETSKTLLVLGRWLLHDEIGTEFVV